MKKLTFTLDEDAIRALDRAAERLDLPKSRIVREALALYDDHLGRLSGEERERLLRTFDRVLPALAERREADVAAELRAAREARRTGGRASRGAP